MMRRRRQSGVSDGGFTLIEVLVTLFLMALVLPAIMRGISASSSAASAARHRTEAAGIAESKLSEIVAGSLWRTGNLSGDFSLYGPAYQGYRWQATVTPWSQDTSGMGLNEIDLTVTWPEGGHSETLELSTLAYNRGQQEG